MAYDSRPIYLQVPTVETPKLKKNIDSFLESWLENHTLEDNTQLYHYTDLRGLRGILKNREIWMSHISTLNDPLEIKYGQEIIKSELNEWILKEDDEDLREFYNNIRVSVGAFGKTMFHTFIACFCESGNLLSQWRAYANKGGGYNLGFEFNNDSFNKFEKEDLAEGSKPLLRKIIYDKGEQITLVRDYLKIATEGVKNGFRGNAGRRVTKNQHAAIMGSQAANILLDMLLSFKHPAFEEEKEWRLIHVSLEDHDPEILKFRETNNGIIPYKLNYIYNHNDDRFKFPLKSVNIGPSLDQENQKAVIQLLINHNATLEDPINISDPQLIQVSGAGYDLR